MPLNHLQVDPSSPSPSLPTLWLRVGDYLLNILSLLFTMMCFHVPKLPRSPNLRNWQSSRREGAAGDERRSGRVIPIRSNQRPERAVRAEPARSSQRNETEGSAI